MQTTPSTQVLFEELPAKQGKLGKIILNRPESLNALSPEMIVQLDDKLRAWAIDDSICAVILTSSSDKAFCAGGDIKHIYMVGPKNYVEDIPFFRIEYRLNKFISTYPKPYISFVQGITMGGGLGVSVNGHTVIAAENLKMAMPETGIGFYPDTGATYFLSRLKDYIGMYIGLTGNVLTTSDALYCGLINYHVPQAQFAALIQELCQVDVNEFDSLIEQYAKNPGKNSLHMYIDIIKSCFKMDTVEQIIECLLDKNNSWATKTAEHLLTRSPTSMKVTHRAFTHAKQASMSEAMNVEYNLTLNIVRGHDFHEGVRAVLVDKTHDPIWKPSLLADVTQEQIDAIFEKKWLL